MPPRAKVMAPAVAASGLPVIATQCLPCSTGLTVRSANASWLTSRLANSTTIGLKRWWALPCLIIVLTPASELVRAAVCHAQAVAVNISKLFAARAVRVFMPGISRSGWLQAERILYGLTWIDADIVAPDQFIGEIQEKEFIPQNSNTKCQKAVKYRDDGG